MNIGQASKRSQVPSKTIRYYESIGLIPAAARTAGGYRDYADSDVQVLKFVHRARSLGFSISDVGGLLSLWNDRARASSDVKKLTERHIQDIERRMTELEEMRSTLKNLADRCHGDDRPDCPIINELSAAD